MRYPLAFTMMPTPLAATAHDGAHLHPHGAEPAVTGIAVLALLAVASAALFRGQK
jgi:hypothetical protein